MAGGRELPGKGFAEQRRKALATPTPVSPLPPGWGGRKPRHRRGHLASLRLPAVAWRSLRGLCSRPCTVLCHPGPAVHSCPVPAERDASLVGAEKHVPALSHHPVRKDPRGELERDSAQTQHLPETMSVGTAAGVLPAPGETAEPKGKLDSEAWGVSCSLGRRLTPCVPGSAWPGLRSLPLAQCPSWESVPGMLDGSPGPWLPGVGVGRAPPACKAVWGWLWCGICLNPAPLWPQNWASRTCLGEGKRATPAALEGGLQV